MDTSSNSISSFDVDNIVEGSSAASETLYGRLCRVAAQFPKRIAYEFWRQKFSYEDFLNQVDVAAKAWQNVGVAEGDSVCLCMGGCPNILISVYALDRLGATVALCVPDYTPDQFVRFVAGTKSKFALVSANQYNNYFKKFAAAGLERIVIGRYSDYLSGLSNLEYCFNPLSSYDKPYVAEGSIKVLFWETVMSEVGRTLMSDDYIEPPVCSDNNHTVVRFISFSFREDIVAAQLSAKAVNNTADREMFIYHDIEKKLNRPSRILCLNEYCYGYGFTIGIHDALMSGQTVLLFTWFDTDRMTYAINKYKPDTLVSYAGTLAKFNGDIDHVSSLKSVSFIICGGGLLTSTQRAGIMDIFDRLGKSCEIHTLNGYDETASCFYASNELSNDRSLGLPLAGVHIKIVDRESRYDVPIGEEGEIAVCSDVYCNGYLMADGTEKNPFVKLSDGRHWFLTGEIGKENDDGLFFYLGTYNRIFKIGSTPIYPIKVDKVVAMCEGVSETASVVIDTLTGPILVAAVVPEESYFYNNGKMEQLQAAIKEECTLMLPEEMIPSEVEFFASIPKHADGTIEYRKLVERVIEMRKLLSEAVSDDE